MSDQLLLTYIILNELVDDDLVKVSKSKKKIWCKDWYLRRSEFSHISLMNELRVSAPLDLKNFLRMDQDTYEQLLLLVKPLIERSDTHMRDAISVNERLSATLRFLATGQSFADLKFLTAISPQSMGNIVIETCVAIIKTLKNYIKIPKTEEEWKDVAQEFENKWNYPNCIGAIDGKHVEIRKPCETGSYYFNYKKTFSIVLLAIVNANYEFIMVEAGGNGRVSDGGIFSNCKFYEGFSNHLLEIPEPAELPGFPTKMPFVLIADDAFPLQFNIMKPYSGENLSPEQLIFNYRLSRARRLVENAFGILSSRFRIFLTKINLSPEKATIITLAACYLHNFLRAKNPSVYLRGSTDAENVCNGEIQKGTWRSEQVQMTSLQPTRGRNPKQIAKEVRDQFSNYFNGVGAVSWQSNHLK